jgi:putative aldouronate transport system permease protein
MRRSKYLGLYSMMLPGALYFVIFCYLPMVGLLIAFQDYSIVGGIFHSPWVGFKNFQMAFTSSFFFEVLRNTVLISFFKIVFSFPIPIILALLLYEIRSGSFFKRAFQTVSYLPHFISWVVMAMILKDILSLDSGVVNKMISGVGGKPIYFLGSKQWFRTVLVASEIWKEAGWSSILYIAALTSIDPQLYEAAHIDGANRFRQMLHVTLPGLRSTVTLVLILTLGNILNAGFYQIFTLYNQTVYAVADIIDTWVYRNGIQQMQYGLATAVGLFKSLIGFAFVFGANAIVKRAGETGIW